MLERVSHGPVDLGIASPGFLVSEFAESPTQARTSPCLILERRASFKESQVMEPMVPGVKRNR